MSNTKEHFNEDDQIETINKIKRPSLYKVLLLNDDFTPMDFVIFVLQDIFNHSSEKAFEIMSTVHEKGSALAGIFTKEVAETKMHQVRRAASEQKYPLRCKMEKE